MKKTLFFVLLVFALLLFISCPETGNNDDREDFPAYTPQIVWKTEVDSFWYGTSPFPINGEYIYLIESNSSAGTEYSNGEYFFDVKKISLKDGSVVWKSETFPCKIGTKLTLQNNQLYVMGSKRLFIFNESDGVLRATIAYGWNVEGVTGAKCDILQVNDKYVFWNYGSINIDDDNSGIARLELEKIDFSKNPKEVQEVAAEVFWRDTSKYEHGVYVTAQPLLHDNVLYFLTFNNFWKEPCVLYAADADSGEIIWSKKWEEKIENGRKITLVDGNTNYPLYIFDGKLLLAESSFYFFDLKTGKVLSKYEYSDKKYKTKITFSGGGIDGPSVVKMPDGYFYSTSGATDYTASTIGADPKVVRNIFKFDKNFNVIWSDMISGCGTMNVRPVVIDGKCFILSDGLFVYDAETGERIGADMSLNWDYISYNTQYDGNFIGIIYDIPAQKNWLIAIKP